ncbi:MAG: amidophosphoribosyltransferase [Candidatus Edwardsbacteria bacterium]
MQTAKLSSKISESCGLFGLWGDAEAVRLTVLGLYALQHRGQESAGIVSTEGENIYEHKGLGLVSDVFDEIALSKLKGSCAIGHNRYSTTGSTSAENIQPLLVDYKWGKLALAHNGNLVNATSLRQNLEATGSIFQTTSDTEVIVHLLARAKDSSFLSGLKKALQKIRGAYSLILLNENLMIALKDPHGFRPLCFGRLSNSFVVASESCALDIIGAKYEREIKPGEMLIFSKKNKMRSYFWTKHLRQCACIFEFIYFARPDSRIFGESADGARRQFGRRLASEHPVFSADMVIAVPDSSNSIALGYAEKSGIPLELGLIRNHYIGRTFIHPSQDGRDFGVRIKYNPVQEILQGKKVVLVDDSIVRGSTSQKLIKMIRSAGALEIHMRIGSPPIRFPCFYGIDTPTRKELIASHHSVEQIRKHLGVDTLGYLSLKGLLEVAPLSPNEFCVACFSGDYPVKYEKNYNKFGMEK